MKEGDKVIVLNISFFIRKIKKFFKLEAYNINFTKEIESKNFYERFLY